MRELQSCFPVSDELPDLLFFCFFSVYLFVDFPATPASSEKTPGDAAAAAAADILLRTSILIYKAHTVTPTTIVLRLLPAHRTQG